MAFLDRDAAAVPVIYTISYFPYAGKMLPKKRRAGPEKNN